MDAVNFIRGWTRMCINYGERCEGCPLFGETSKPCDLPYHFSEVMVDVVQKWSEEHPIKSNGDKLIDFVEENGGQFFGCNTGNGVITISTSLDWWDAEYKE